MAGMPVKNARLEGAFSERLYGEHYDNRRETITNDIHAVLVAHKRQYIRKKKESLVLVCLF